MFNLLSQKKASRIAYLLFFIVTILVVWPFWKRGFVLTLDMVFAPSYNIDFEGLSEGYRMYNSLPLDYLLKGLSWVLGGELVQKLILTFIFLASGISMFMVLPVKSFTGRFAGGLIYMINPLVHQRLLAGHWNFLLAYAITPIVIWGLYQWFTNKKFATWKVALLWTIAIILNVHHAFILLIVWLALFLGRLFYETKKIEYLLRQLKLALWMIIFNLFWILPFFLNSGHELILYSVDHLTAFATRPDSRYGMMINLLGMYGFWREFTDLEITKSFLSGFWVLGVIALVTLAWIGVMRLLKRKDKRWLGISLVIVFTLSILLSLGSSGELWFVNQWIYQFIPGFKGMREPQKFLALLPLIYAIGIAIALERSKRIRFKKWQVNHYFGGFILLIIAIYNFGLFHGAGLETSKYPESWHALKNEATQETKILSLPFKLYGYSNIANRDLMDPIPRFFSDQTVISSRNSEKVGIRNEKQTSMDTLMKKGALDDKLISKLLAEQSIDYIILKKQGDYKKYEFLAQHPDLKIHSDDEHSTIYSIDKIT